MVQVRLDSLNPRRWYLDFDVASPGGNGGGSLLIDSDANLVSIDIIHKNDLLRRQTGKLLAESLTMIGVPEPVIIEMNNVREPGTLRTLMAGSNGQGTLIGNTLSGLVSHLNGVVADWLVIRDRSAIHLQVHVLYPWEKS